MEILSVHTFFQLFLSSNNHIILIQKYILLLTLLYSFKSNKNGIIGSIFSSITPTEAMVLFIVTAYILLFGYDNAITNVPINSLNNKILNIIRILHLIIFFCLVYDTSS